MELIDTLWNVNTNEELAICRDTVELIDTLWNVNSKGVNATIGVIRN